MLTEYLITDPFFYLVAAPAVVLLGISKSGFGAGFGSLAVPLMAMAVTVPQAAAILMPLLLVIDVLGIAAYRRDFDLTLLKFLVPWGLVGTLVGYLIFSRLETHWVSGLVGFFTLLFLAQRLMFPPFGSRHSAATLVGGDLDHAVWLYQFHCAHGGSSGECLFAAHAFAPCQVCSHFVGVFFLHEFCQMGAVCRLGFVGLAQPRHGHGVDALGSAGGVVWRAYCAPHQTPAVLSNGVSGHVSHGKQVAVGRMPLKKGER